jgi:hypothetical protein
MVQNLISFYSFDQELSMGLKITWLRLREKKQTILTPSTSSKCSTLTEISMMLKIGENLVHLLHKHCFKFDTNPTMDLGRKII